jgi:hypothetical protein
VPGSPMPFGQLKHLFMSSVGSFSTPGSWQVLSPLILGLYLFSLGNKINYFPSPHYS